MFTILLMACSTQQSTETELFTQDLEELSRAMETVGLQPESFSSCSSGPGTCSSCLDGTGTALSGTWTLALETSPCEVASSSDARSYTIEDSTFEGTWTTGIDGVTVTLVGGRSVRPSGDGASSRGWVATDLSIDDAQMVVNTDGEVSSFSMEGTYSGVSGRSSHFTVSESEAGVLEGSLTGPTLTCTVSGTRDAPQVACTD